MATMALSTSTGSNPMKETDFLTKIKGIAHDLSNREQGGELLGVLYRAIYSIGSDVNNLKEKELEEVQHMPNGLLVAFFAERALEHDSLTPSVVSLSRIEGKKRFIEMLDAEGGCVDAETAFKLSGSKTLSAFNKKRTRHGVISFKLDGQLVYPLFQFDVAKERIYPGIAAVIEHFGDNLNEATIFLLQQGPSGKRPLDYLKEANVQLTEDELKLLEDDAHTDVKNPNVELVKTLAKKHLEHI